MKYALLLIGVGLAFVAGYVSEPMFRDSLTGVRDPVESAELPDDGDAVAERSADDVAPVQDVTPPPPTPDLERIEDEPAEEVEVEPLLRSWEIVRLSDDEIREIMIASLDKGEIGHFNAEQIISWNTFGEKEIDGELVHYGRIDYAEETTRGERTFEAEALIRGGKVEKWIWTRSGIRID